MSKPKITSYTCPFCGSDQIEDTDGPDYEGGSCWWHGVCLNCHRELETEYRFAGAAYRNKGGKLVWFNADGSRDTESARPDMEASQ